MSHGDATSTLGKRFYGDFGVQGIVPHRYALRRLPSVGTPVRKHEVVRLFSVSPAAAIKCLPHPCTLSSDITSSGDGYY